MQINSFADSLFGIQSGNLALQITINLASPPAHIKATSFYDQKRKIVLLYIQNLNIETFTQTIQRRL